MNSWLTGNFYYTKIFVVVFLVDFFIRIFINPKYSPSLIIGRFFVQNQKPEYVGAPQKRFAWAIGLILAITMLYLIVLNNVIGPINLFVCLACLILLFFETAFGICIGCKIYNLFNKEKAQLCPGGVCEITSKEEIQKINFPQLTMAVLFIAFVISVPTFGIIQKDSIKTESVSTNETVNTNYLEENNLIPNTKEECEVPEWAIKIGHEEQWKLHNGCK